MTERWIGPPPKEGRPRSLALLLNGRRQILALRLCLLLFVVGVVYLTFTPASLPPSSELSQVSANELSELHESQPVERNPADHLEAPDNDATAQHAISDHTPHSHMPNKESQQPLDESGPILPEEDDAKALQTPKTSSKMSLKTDTKLEAALSNLISLGMPNEITTRGLLRPVVETGGERMREMGLRTRAYKAYFEAWEDIHFVPSGEDVLIRDDIIQYLREHQGFAESLTSSFAETVRTYEWFRIFLPKLGSLLFPWTAPYFADHMKLHTHFKAGGRGIVLSCGDDQAPYLLASIASFRKLGCELPIEIMYLGESDLGEDHRLELEELPGVITRDMSQMVTDNGWNLAGWAGKPFSILFSSFREVIFIDADALFFRDPEILFDDPRYLETGALFFKDRIIMPESKKSWLKEILPRPISRKAKQTRYWTGQSGHMQESGVVVVDKWKHFMALLMVTRMNGPDRDGNEDENRVGVYDLVYGDKETFWLGWELVGDLGYSFHDGDAGAMGTLQTRAQIEARDRKKHPERYRRRPGRNDTTEKDLNDELTSQNFTICAPQLLHLDTDDRPLWFNGGLLSNKFAERGAKVGMHFEVFLKEPTDGRQPDPWQLEENNEACLTTDETSNFTPEEMETLDMIVGIAKDTGAWGATW